jgi:hypothetical protein
MIRVIEWSITLVGPICFGMLLTLYIARRACPANQFLQEISDPMVIIAASVVALAIAGLIAPVL